MLDKKGIQYNSTKLKNKTNKFNILLFLIFNLFFENVKCEILYNKIGKLISDSEIILTIKGNNYQKLFEYNYQNPKPSEILVNGIKINTTNNVIFLELEENNVTIKYNQKLKNCAFMFNGLSSITNIVFKEFDTSAVTSMNKMFWNCSNLRSLDLSNLNTSLVTDMTYMFDYCSNLTSINLSGFDTSSVKDMTYMFGRCTNLLLLDLSSFDTSSVTNMGYMFVECRNLISLDLRNFDTSSVTRMDYMFAQLDNLISLDLSNFNTSSVKNNNNMFMMFFYSNSLLKYCINNNSNNALLSHIISNNYEFKNNNNCSDICFSKNKKIILRTKKCALNCDTLLEYEFNDICYFLCRKESYINNNVCILNDYDYNNSITLNKDEILLKLEKELIDGNSEIINMIEQENKDLVLKLDNIIYQFTSTYNQNNNEYNNMSTINLGECESYLKNNYNNNITLLIVKIDIFKKGLLIPIIEYKIFNSKIKQFLDINICKFIKTNISIPVNIDENNLFKYNSSHEYYNDFCYSFSTDKKTDIIIKDRREEYINKNMSLCEKNCKYSGYNKNTKKVLCECFIKIKFPVISEIVINKDRLINNFIDIKRTMNIIVMKCYKNLFSKEGLIKNIGNYIIGIIIIFTIILCILFNMKGYNELKNKINEIIKNKIENENIKSIENNIEKEKKMQIKNNTKNREKLNKLKTSDEKSNKENTKLELKNHKSVISIIGNKNHNISEKNNNSQNLLINKNNILNNMNYNDYELNNLSYEDALKMDKRTYNQYYFSLLKTKHIILFTFYINSDYNSKIIKIILFLFSFALYFTINALFFNDETMHKIFEDQGKFNFIYQIPQILYSTIISSFINIIIKYLSLTEKKIIEIKNEKNDVVNKSIQLLKSIIIKFIIFFILIFIFLILFWYYLSCFCAVYENTQIHLIKDTIISFGLSLLYPFVLYLLPGIFRIPSLNYKKKEYLYTISTILQLI